MHHSLSAYASVATLALTFTQFLSVVAIEHMGGPEIPWRAGRKDAAAPTASTTTLPDGRLPNADMGCPSATNSHVRDIFGRMGFNDRYCLICSQLIFHDVLQLLILLFSSW